MSRFLLGDELGNIKTIRYICAPGLSDAEKTVSRTIYSDNVDGVSKNAIQALAVGPQSNGSQLVRNPFQLYLAMKIHNLLSAYTIRWRQVFLMVPPLHLFWAGMTLCKLITSGKRSVCAPGVMWAWRSRKGSL
jgi:hypothetical protein